MASEHRFLRQVRHRILRIMASEYRPSDIVLVRHGESLWNAHGMAMKKVGNSPPGMEGVPDHKTPLTKRGIAQARNTGLALEEEFSTFDAIYYSPFLRTQQTASIMVEACYSGWSGTPLRHDLLLKEQNFGWLDAALYDVDENEEFRGLQRRFDKQRKLTGKFYATPPNGDSWYDVALRTHDFLDKLFVPQWHRKRILVVSHAVTIATFFYHLQGRDEEATVKKYQGEKLANCSVTHFRHNPKTPLHWDLVDWNKVLRKDE